MYRVYKVQLSGLLADLGVRGSDILVVRNPLDPVVMASIGQTARRRVEQSDIDSLKSVLSARNTAVLSPSDAEYLASLKRWSSAAEKPAGAVVVPATVEEVSDIVKYANEQGLDLAVKGGGHSTAGVSSTNGGLLIDLGKMRRVDVDRNHKLFRIQGGANWGDVDNAGVKHGLATVGGTVTDTGVGGLTLGGGYGWLSGQYGLVIDNLVECTIVLANGDIKRARQDENADLFWALRGAGQNFGVVTEFVLKAYDQGDVWAGLLLYPSTTEIIEKVVAATNDIYGPKEGRTKIAGRAGGGIALARPPPANGQVMLLVPIIFFGTEEEGKQAFKPFFDIGPVVSTMAMVPYPVINTILAAPIGLRASMKGAAFTMPIRAGFVQEVLQEYVKFTEGNEDRGASLVLWEVYDPSRVTSKEGGAFANRGWHLNGMICPIWTKIDGDQECRQWARDVNEMFKAELARSGPGTGTGVDGGVGLRGKKGAVLLYGNYDRK